MTTFTHVISAIAPPLPPPSAGLIILAGPNLILAWDGNPAHLATAYPVDPSGARQADVRGTPLGQQTPFYGSAPWPNAALFDHATGVPGIYAASWNPTTGGLDAQWDVTTPAPLGLFDRWGGAVAATGEIFDPAFTLALYARSRNWGTASRSSVLVKSIPSAPGSAQSGSTVPADWHRGTDTYPGGGFTGLTLKREQDIFTGVPRLFSSEVDSPVQAYPGGVVTNYVWASGAHEYGMSGPAPLAVPMDVIWRTTGEMADPASWATVDLVPACTTWNLSGITAGDYPAWGQQIDSDLNRQRGIITAAGAGGRFFFWRSLIYTPASGVSGVYSSRLLQTDGSFHLGFRVDGHAELAGLGQVTVGPLFPAWDGTRLVTVQALWTGYTTTGPGNNNGDGTPDATFWLWTWNGPSDPANWTYLTHVTAPKTTWNGPYVAVALDNETSAPDYLPYWRFLFTDRTSQYTQSGDFCVTTYDPNTATWDVQRPIYPLSSTPTFPPQAWEYYGP